MTPFNALLAVAVVIFVALSAAAQPRHAGYETSTTDFDAADAPRIVA